MRITSSHKRLDTWFHAVVEEGTRQEADRVVRESIEYGANVMRDNIATRGTAKSGKRGRIDTGAMLAGVDDRVVENSDRRVVGEFGWLDPTDFAVPYPLFQEYGFEHPSGEMIEPMLALTDAFDETVANIEEDFGRRL
jgi:hypothetical protein